MKGSSFRRRLIYVLFAILIISPGIVRAVEPGRYDMGTVFSFHFNEGRGKEVEDSSGNKNNGNFGGGKLPNWVDGPEAKFGSALEFFDCNHVEIPESPSLDTGNEITFETWINLKSLTASWSTIYSKHSQGVGAGFHWIFIYQDGRLSYQYANGANYVTLAVKIDWEFDKWTHIAISHKIDDGKGGVVKWYVNGEQVSEQKHADKAFEVIGGKASLGTYQSMTAPERYELDGMLDEVRLSPRVKTDAEIKESMNALAVEFREKLADMWGRIKVQ